MDSNLMCQPKTFQHLVFQSVQKLMKGFQLRSFIPLYDLKYQIAYDNINFLN